MNRLLYQQDDFPVFQNRMYDTAAQALHCQKGRIRLVEDSKTGLVYNAHFEPELMVYDCRYQNEQAVSPMFQRHLDEVAQLVERNLGRNQLVEVGCGKAFFLDLLLSRGFDITGFDPTYEGSNSRVRRQYFAPGLLERSSGVILRHVLEHVQNPVAFLRQIGAANGGQGKIYIEVPCFDWICAHRAWFDVFYEHVNYFRMNDFGRMFGRIFERGRLFGGQYLYVVADLATLREPMVDKRDCVVFPPLFTESIVCKTQSEAVNAAIWGGASKGVIFALLKARAGQPVRTVIDMNPAKQGKFLPGTGLEVKSPENAMAELPSGSVIHVMNSMYLDEIRRMSNNKYTYVTVDHE